MRIGRANGQDWLRLGEAAAELGVSLNTLRRWSDAGRLTCYRSPGGHRRYRRSDVDSLLRAEDRGAAPRSPTGRLRTAAGPFAAEDLRAPLMALARVAAEGVGVTGCRISVPAGDGFVVLSARSRTGGHADDEVSGPTDALPAVREVLRTGRRLVIADLATTGLLGRADAEAHRQRGDAAVLAVPLTDDGRNRAVMELVESRAPRAFNGANVTFAEFMARQASRLVWGETEDARGEPATLQPVEAVSTPGTPSPRAEELLSTLAERLRHEMRAVACDVLRYDREADTLEPVAVAAAGEPPPLPDLSYPSADFGDAAASLVSGEAVMIHDLPAKDLAGPHLIRRDHGGANSVYAAPIHLGDGIVGLLEVYSDVPERVLHRGELALVDAAAATAALALGAESDSGALARRVGNDVAVRTAERSARLPVAFAQCIKRDRHHRGDKQHEQQDRRKVRLHQRDPPPPPPPDDDDRFVVSRRCKRAS